MRASVDVSRLPPGIERGLAITILSPRPALAGAVTSLFVNGFDKCVSDAPGCGVCPEEPSDFVPGSLDASPTEPADVALKMSSALSGFSSLASPGGGVCREEPGAFVPGSFDASPTKPAVA